MTKKLEDLFNLPPSSGGDGDKPPIDNDTLLDAEDDDNNDRLSKLSNEEKREIIHRVDDLADKIDAALPAIRGLEMEDKELDEYATKLVSAFDDLMTLGYNVDSRFSSEIFNAAGSMMGHALTAKQAKINKKMKTIDLQMKKLKLDSDLKKAAAAGKIAEDDDIPSAEGHILSRNELLELMLGKRDNSDDQST